STDFASLSTGERWRVVERNNLGPAPTVANGALALVAASQFLDLHAGHRFPVRFDEQAVELSIDIGGSIGDGGGVSVQLRKNDVRFEEQDAIVMELRDDGVLQGTVTESGLPPGETSTLGYDAEAHALWRIAEQGDEVVFSASADGSSWTELGRAFSPSWVDHAYFSIEARSGSAGSVEARVDSINPGRVRAPFCPLSALVTELGGNRFTQFTEADGAECSLFQEGDGITFSAVAGGVESACSLRSRGAFAVDGGARIEVVNWNLDDNAGGSLAVADIFAYLSLLHTPKANTPSLSGPLPRAAADVHVSDGSVSCRGDVDAAAVSSAVFTTDITHLSLQRSGAALSCTLTAPTGPQTLSGGSSSIPLDAAFVEIGIYKANGVSTDTSFKISTLNGF
ncbi:MAG: hypothetical protein IT382_12660, partial [Deltaproteobacteria bacterium]|nr:hypothetical protein [Deltaproteobacteria bacterium]